MGIPRRKAVQWSLGGVAVVFLLWLLDASLRSWLLREGRFFDLLLRPSAGNLLARVTLVTLGVVVLLALRGAGLLEVARREAVAERRRLRELYDYTTDAVVLLDRELRIVFMNKTAERVGGKRYAEAIGWPCYRCIMGREEPCKGCGALAVFESGEPQAAMKYEVTASGQENWLDQHWYPMRDGSGEVEAVIEVARDVSDLKLLEREVAACHQAVDAARRTTA